MDSICANPFVLRHNLSCLQWIKLVLGGIILIPLRVLIILIFVIIIFISSNVLYGIKKYIHKPKDYNKVRHHYLCVPMFFLKAMTVAMGFWWVKIKDKSKKESSSSGSGNGDEEKDEEKSNGKRKSESEKSPSKHHGRRRQRGIVKIPSPSSLLPPRLRPGPGVTEAPILCVMPHQSIFDFLAVLYLGLPIIVARYEGSHHWLLRPLTKLVDPILVKRDSHESRKATAESIISRSAVNQILLFPEGTDGTGQMIIRLRMGAFNPKLPVQPVIIKYDYDDGVDNISWVQEGPAFGTQVLLTLCKLYTSVTIIKHEIYFPNEADLANPLKYCDHFHRYTCKISNYRFSHYSFGDSKLLLLCNECSLSRSPAACKLVNVATKVFLTSIKSSLPETDRGMVTKELSHGNLSYDLNDSQAEDTEGRTDQKENSKKRNKPKEVKNETVIVVTPNALFDKKQNDICLNFIERSKKSGKELPSNDLIKKWIDKPEGGEMRKAIHEALANMVREARFDLYPPDATVTKQVLINILNLSYKYDSVIKSPVISELLYTLTLGYSIKISVIELRAFMSLCHTQIVNLWERVELWFRLLGSKTDLRTVGDTSSVTEISMTHFKLLVWYLLGVEPSIFKDEQFLYQRITLRFVKENLIDLFQLAVQQNAQPLLSETKSEESIGSN